LRGGYGIHAASESEEIRVSGEVSGVRIEPCLEMLAPRAFGFLPEGATDDTIRFSLRFPRFWLRQFIFHWRREELEATINPLQGDGVEVVVSTRI
jgi:hypothetical protein